MWSVRQREALCDDQEINSNNMYIFLSKVKYQGTGWEQLIQSQSLARFCFKSSGNLN